MSDVRVVFSHLQTDKSREGVCDDEDSLAKTGVAVKSGGCEMHVGGVLVYCKVQGQTLL
jgi:hypothetical protein